MQPVTLWQKAKERPLWVVALAGVIVQIAASYGLELDREWVTVTLVLITGLVTYLQQRKVTPVVKLERLEESGHIPPGTVEVVKTPDKELPPAFPPDPLDKRT